MGKYDKKDRYGKIGENRHRIYCRLAGLEALGKKLEEMPHKPCLDMVMIWYMRLCIAQNEYLTMLISREQLRRWELTEEELEELAWENTIRDRRAELQKLQEVIRKLGMETEEDAGREVYVISNEERDLGAVTLFYPGMLADLAAKLDSDYYIIPSSVHECLILKCDGRIRPSSLREILVNVNREELLPKDILSNSIYRYQRDTGQLIIDNS